MISSDGSSGRISLVRVITGEYSVPPTLTNTTMSWPLVVRTTYRPSISMSALRSGVPKYCTWPPVTSNSRTTSSATPTPRPNGSRYVPRGVASVPSTRYWSPTFPTNTCPVSWISASLESNRTFDPISNDRLSILRLSSNRFSKAVASPSSRMNSMSTSEAYSVSSRLMICFSIRSAKYKSPCVTVPCPVSVAPYNGPCTA